MDTTEQTNLLRYLESGQEQLSCWRYAYIYNPCSRGPKYNFI